jgi:SAM-dependent methyltransferase
MTGVWPLPALLTWAVAWGLFIALGAVGLPASGFGAGLLLSAVLAWRGPTRMRRLIMFAGFPLSVLAAGQVAIPPLAWLLPLALLALVYPMNAWRDAPVFPTPATALRGLADAAPLPPGARVLDAGCGLGDGLQALHAEYPDARLEGLEWSWPLAALCALRCRFARVRRGDIWRADWSGMDLVYLFQRPESMPRALSKARAEMRRAAGW